MTNDKVEITPATDEAPFFVACFTHMTNDEIDKYLGIDDDSEDDDSDDSASVYEVNMQYTGEEEDDDDYIEWGPPPAAVSMPYMDDTDDEQAFTAQSNLKSTGLDDNEMTEEFDNT